MQLLKHRAFGARRWLFAAAAAAALGGAVSGCGRLGHGASAPTAQAPLRADQAELILKTLADAPSHGYAPSAFPTTGLEDALKSRNEQTRASAQARLTSEIVAYARDQHGLAIPKSAMDKNWGMRPAAFDAAADFQAALAQNRLQPWLASLPPQNPQYEALRKAYLVYLKIAQNGGWRPVPEGPPLKLGSRDVRVAALRQRLTFEDGTLAESSAKAAFDKKLARAVSQFQDRHGLHPTGIVDAPTLAALNVPALARAAQIRANLERRRWTPREAAPTRIEVNSAGQTFDLYLDGQPAMHMLTAAGKPGDETPIVASKIHTVVFNPTWNVPDDIAANELLPKGSEYLQSHNFTQDNGKLVQQPGPDNALGRVKFLFDNAYSVYLHDTPAKAAFDRDQRSVSHGCVRLEKAVDLAKLLLNREAGWPAEKVDEVIASRDTQSVPLKQPIPVIIGYWTAVVSGDQVDFRDDIYGWDAETLRALDAATVSRA
jgi:murein L,D-transpeptidase YcbB/YkuD